MSEKRYYIAYGSNLSVEQMAHRCPDAKVVGTAILYGWQLLFKGCATIEENPRKNTPVLVWEISEGDEQNLDRYEGFPSFYYKKDLQVEVFPQEGGEPRNLTVMVYIMAAGHRLGMPTKYYYNVLAEGYKDFHFPMHILEQALADSIGREEAIQCLGECSLTRKQGTRHTGDADNSGVTRKSGEDGNPGHTEETEEGTGDEICN